MATSFRESSVLLLACAIATGLALAGRSNAAPPPARVGAEARPVPASPPDAGSVLYPPQRLPLRFDHARHLSKGGLTCAYCHTAATTSRRAEDRLLPSAERCDACHGTDHEDLDAVRPGVRQAADCAYCHEGHTPEDGNAVRRVVLPQPELVFDHAAHWARGIPCVRCHAKVPERTLATAADLPRMQSCLECHGAGGSAADRSTCDVCHLTEQGRLRTSFPTGELLPPSWMHELGHGGDFILRHRTVAASDSALCANCHTEKECVDCHDGRVRPRSIHPNDWLGLHAVAARQNDPECTSCHREQSFCVTCHERVGIAQTSPSATLGARTRFHPPKEVWSDPPRTAAHHAFEAERNLTACVSCHNERDCALCHATATRGGRGGLSPHPPGFSATCRGALERNARPCLFCHAPSDPSLAACR